MQEILAKTADIYRDAIFSYIYRLTGSIEDSKDILQEVIIKYITSQNTIENPKSWMFKVATNLTFDFFKKEKIRRQSYIGPWLPDPFIDDNMDIDDSISVALLVLLEKLSPYERVVYILHDLFEFKHKDIILILDISLENSRKILSRANKKLNSDKVSYTPSKSEHYELTSAFVKAAKDGCFEKLVSLFSTEVKLHSDGGGKAIAAKKIIYRDNIFISKFLLKVTSSLFALNKHNVELKTFWFNGSLGVLQIEENKITTSYNFEIKQGQIGSIFAFRNPDKLKHFSNYLSANKL